MKLGAIGYGIILLAGLSGVASAQEPPAPAPAGSIQSRHDALQKLQEALSDPDPFTRLATMEQAVQSGDATETYFGLRTALSSDDPNMRELGMRIWLSTLRRLTLDVVLPAEVQKLVDQATIGPNQDAKPLQAVWMQSWASRGFQISFAFTDMDVGKNAGKVRSLPGWGGQPPEDDFSVSGTQIEVVTETWFPSFNGSRPCSFRFAPTSKLTLEGTVSCSLSRDPSPRLAISGPMF